jgi:hypothetical protein
MVTRNNYEPAEEYTDEAYLVSGWGAGIAWYVLGWETEPDEDTVWTGYEVRTGRLICRMVGDDRNFSVAPEDVGELEPGTWCHECGQVGCMHGAWT